MACSVSHVPASTAARGDSAVTRFWVGRSCPPFAGKTGLCFCFLCCSAEKLRQGLEPQWPRVCEDRSGGASVPAEGLAFLGKGAGVLELGQGSGHTSLQESPELGKRRGRCTVTGVVSQGHCRVSGPASRAHCAVLSFYGLLGSDAGLETGPQG